MPNLIIKRVIKIFFMSILCFFSFSFAAGEVKYNDILKDFFSEPFENYGDREGCEIKCRALSEKSANRYYTKIVDFDATTGVTTCDVIPQNSSDI